LRAALLGMSVLIFAAGAAAQDDDMDAVLGGFDDAPPESAETAPADAEPELFELGGSVEFSVSYNYRGHRSATGTDYVGFQRLRTRLNLQLDVALPQDWKLRLAGYGFADPAYLIYGRDDYSEAVLDRYELDADFLESWIQGRLTPELDVKLGRQVVIWGRSDTIRVLDVINPLDNREPGRVDIEDLRRPVGMLRTDYYRGPWSISALAIPEIRFDLDPPTGSDFAIDSALGSGSGAPSVVTLHESIPDDFSNWELALALNGTFEGWDISFHGAWFFEDRPHVVNSTRPEDQIEFATPGGPLPVGIRLGHGRQWLVGGGGNYTFGSWLAKAEFAYIGGVDFCDEFPRSDDPNPPPPPPLPPGAALLPCLGEEKDRIDAMLGLEYYGIENATVALEVANRRLLDFESSLRGAVDFAQQNTEEIAFRYTQSFFREKLDVTLLAYVLGYRAQDGAILRLSADYDLRDALVLSGGILLFESGDTIPLSQWGRNDRLFFGIKWSF
jgi:hypothetical protein